MIIFFLYRLVQFLAFPLLLLYLLGRAIWDRRYWRGLGERLGILGPLLVRTSPGAIWLHAVSVGEVQSIVELLKRLRMEMPDASMMVSTTTIAGRQLASQKLTGLADGIFYAPIDYVFAVRRVLRCLRPSLLVILETEIWPNLYHEAKRFGCRVLVVNGRISDIAFPKYQRFAWLFRPVLRLADRILAQTEVSASRYRNLGGEAIVAGNLKYDWTPKENPAGVIEQWIRERRPGAVLVAASTMPPREPEDPDEDDVVIEAFTRLAHSQTRLLLILAPRRPERFAATAAKLGAAGIPFVRRSALDKQADLALPGVLLLDSIGELGALFAVADLVFMGGTLASRGGHNVLEPAGFGKPVIVGPHMENFPEIAADFREAQAWIEIREPRDLAGAIEELLARPPRRRELGERARAIAGEKRGTTERVVSEIRHQYALALPVRPPSLLTWVLLGPLAALWRTVSEWKRQSAHVRNLDTPVISVGGLAMGGVGKTPVVLALADGLLRAGERPAVLTRGYRRRSPEKCTIVMPGETLPVEITGDEAQLYMHHGGIPVGISAGRYGAGRELERRATATVMLLDDGFQHWPLPRALDIVLIDALDPLAGGGLFPLGRLREPFSALVRAHLVLVTRAPEKMRLEGIENLVRRYNATAPILYVRMRSLEWRELSSDASYAPDQLPTRRLAAFCGLGNPESFWRSIEQCGYRPAFRWRFGDHHHYKPAQCQRLAAQAQGAGAEALLTTEKDTINLDADARAAFGKTPVFWLRIAAEIEGGEHLVNWMNERLRTGP